MRDLEFLLNEDKFRIYIDFCIICMFLVYDITWYYLYLQDISSYMINAGILRQ